VTILLGDGDGTFQNAVTYDPDGTAYGLPRAISTAMVAST